MNGPADSGSIAEPEPGNMVGWASECIIAHHWNCTGFLAIAESPERCACPCHKHNDAQSKQDEAVPKWPSPPITAACKDGFHPSWTSRTTGKACADWCECGCHEDHVEEADSRKMVAEPSEPPDEPITFHLKRGRLIQDGWLCPRCDIIVAPMYRRCEWCGPEELAK